MFTVRFPTGADNNAEALVPSQCAVQPKTNQISQRLFNPPPPPRMRLKIYALSRLTNQAEFNLVHSSVTIQNFQLFK